MVRLEAKEHRNLNIPWIYKLVLKPFFFFFVFPPPSSEAEGAGCLYLHVQRMYDLDYLLCGRTQDDDQAYLFSSRLIIIINDFTTERTACATEPWPMSLSHRWRRQSNDCILEVVGELEQRGVSYQERNSRRDNNIMNHCYRKK